MFKERGRNLPPHTGEGAHEGRPYGGGRERGRGCWVGGVGFALCSVWFVGFWVGDGRSGTRMQDLFGTYADATSIGGCPAVSPRMPWGTCRCRGRPWVGHIRPASALDRCADGISARCRRGRMEPHKGTKALDNEPIDSRKSSARVKSARRIRPGKGRRIGKGVDIEA